MMMSEETFALFFLCMAGITWFLLQRHGEKEYQQGITEGIIMHSQGRLTYTTYLSENEEEMIDIVIAPEEEG